MRWKINKQGSVYDAFHIMAGVMLFVFMVLIGGRILMSFNEKVQSNSAFETSTNSSREIVSSLTNKWSVIFDNTMLIVWAGAWILAFILAWLVDVHPAFAVFALVIMAIIVLFSVIVTNIYSKLIENNQLRDIADSLPKINFLFQHFIQVNLAMSVLLLIFTFAKSRSGLGGAYY